MTSRTEFPLRWGAACGLLAAAAAIGIGQLLAGFTVPAASPVVAVGGAAIVASRNASGLRRTITA